MNIVISADIDQFLVVKNIKNGYSYNSSISYTFTNRLVINNVPREVFNMSWLREVSFSGLFKDCKIPKNIINLRDTSELNISSCNITDLIYLRYLRNLRSLAMHNNKKIDISTVSGLTITIFDGSRKNSKIMLLALGDKLCVYKDSY